MMGCKVTNLIEGAVATMDENSTVREAAKTMVRHQTGSVVVIDSGQVVGFFTERDLLKRVVAKELDPSKVRLKEVTTRNLITVSHTSTCAEALRLMKENSCRHLLAFDGKRFLGVLTIRDLALVVGEQHAKEDFMVNLLGGLTLILTVIVIGLLAFQVPRMLEVVLRVLG
jgi:signal-transduction protein with cAMP-binding, CBS, and nucleotidyltransferase domain